MGLRTKLIVGLLLFWVCLFAENERVYVTASKFNTDEIIAKLDSLSGLSFPGNYSLNTISKPDLKRKFSHPELAYEVRISKLNKLSPIEYEYNEQVKKYIELFTIERRDQFQQIIGLSELYFPVFDEYLDKYNLPLEIKYLAIVESALNPLAVSVSNAVGLWQFKIGTAKMLDLNVSSYIDERCDPVKSTEAACRYLQYLYRIFGDWNMAIAAYNGGPGEIKKAIQRSGGKTNYWEIQSYLPEQTQNYIPAFIAASYVMNFHKAHKLRAIKPVFNYWDVDSVHVKNSVSFEQISNIVDIPLEQLRFLNPVYKLDYIPIDENTISLILPQQRVKTFLDKENEIYSVSENRASKTSNINGNSTKGKIRIYHKVKRGDIFHSLAIKYGCTIENLLIWNKLDSTRLLENQIIEIWVSPMYLSKLKIEK